MDIQEFGKRMKFDDDTLKKFEPGWQELLEHSSEFLPDFMRKEFYTKYSRYIQEGSWTDDNYMDDDLYYLDSLSVLYQSAYPKVTYNFTPLDLKYLEGYEDFDF